MSIFTNDESARMHTALREFFLSVSRFLGGKMLDN